MNEKLRLFIAGYCSGASLVMAGHPFDTIKVRLQSEGKGGRFRGPLHCLTETVTKEGLGALYKGVTPPLVATGCINSVLFTMQALMVKRIAADPSKPQVTDSMKAALASGALISLLVTPMEGVKARLQVQYAARPGAAAYKGPIDCAMQVLRSQGLAHGLYRGWLMTVYCRMSNWAYFGGYAAVQGWLAAHGGEGRSARFNSVAAGGGAGVAYWLTCFPADVVKNRMQTMPSSDPLYATVRSTVSHIWAREGWRGFFRGFAPCMLRAIPANAAAFTGYEMALRHLPSSS